MPPNAWAYGSSSMFKMIQTGSCGCLSAAVCVGLWVWHVNNLNQVVRPVDVAKVGIQNVYRIRYKNYEVMKLSSE